MDFQDIVLKNRSYRRFDASKKIDEQTLIDLVDLARQTPSAGNQQPLKYLVSADDQTNAKIFAALGWAASLPEWPGPDEEERPTGYIVVLHDTKINSGWVGTDSGIAIQTMLLAAVEKGLGGVMFGNIRKKMLRESLPIPLSLDIVLVVAFGTPVEKIVLEDVGKDGSVKYHRDAENTHYVPKRTLDEVIVKI